MGTETHTHIAWSSVLLLYGIELVLFFPFTADDAFIVARYAENLVEYHELVFNAGERVTALTSPLHALTSAFLNGTFGHTISTNKYIAIFVVLACSIAAMQSLKVNQRILFAVFVLCSPFVALWTLGGLETPYLLAITTGIVIILRRECTSPAQLLLASILMGCAVLTRYDAAPFIFPIAAYLFFQNLRKPRMLLAMSPGLLLVIGWLGFSLLYYHDIFPTPYYRKLDYSYFGSVVNGIYEIQILILSGLWLFFPIFLRPGLLSAARFKITRTYLRTHWWLCAGLLLTLLYGLITATVHMMFSYRLLVPYLPAFILFGIDVSNTVRMNDGAKPWLIRFPAWTALGMVCFQAFLTYYIYTKSVNPSLVGEYQALSARSYAESFIPVMRTASEDIRRHWQEQQESQHRSPRVYTFAGGVLPYYLREAYIYEELVSFRKHCQCDLKRSADYIHLIVPRHGTVTEQLPLPLDKYRLVSEYEIVFDGRQESFRVYYYPRAEGHCLPPYVDGVCLKP